VSLLLGTESSLALNDPLTGTSDALDEHDEEVLRTETMVVYERASDCSISDRGSAVSNRHSFTLASRASKVSVPSPKGSMIRFTVKDYGKGIEKSDFQTIFQPFRQANAETERVYGGTGLGLAVTSKLVASMGGTITVDSAVGEWSEFTFDLPFHDVPVDIEQLCTRLSDTSILLVDDDASTIRDMSRVFCECALDFYCCKTLHDAAIVVEKDGRRNYVCLVHEKLFGSSEYQSLADTAKVVLVSHGPKYAVKESKGHYRSPAKVLPSVLVESLASFVELTHEELEKTPSVVSVMENSCKELRFLIVEDNPVNQKVFLHILNRLDLRNVTVVSDGQKACEQVLQAPYDFIWMDIQLPIMSGIDACKQILSSEMSHPKPKVVFVSSHVSELIEASCRDVGGIDFLAKPLRMNMIQDCILRHVQTMGPLPGLDASGVKVSEDGTLRVLAAVSDEMNRHILLRILGRLHVNDVDVVSDGRRACEKERQQAYDIILMDIQLPVMTGIEACTTIMNRDIDRRKPRIILLADGEQKTNEFAGVCEMVTRPLNTSKIESCLYNSVAAAPLKSCTDVLVPLKVEATNNRILRILIAEDNKINQKVLLRVLERLNYLHVEVVDNGKDACDKELESEYDVILMDLQMPVMNGIEACKMITSRETDHARPKIVFLTAHVADSFEADCRAAGGTEFLTKPINIGSLEACLRRMMER
jgi:CheY-like chemotaxis protein